MLYLTPILVIWFYFFSLNFAGPWFTDNSLFHSLIVEHLISLSKEGVLNDSLKEWYFHLAFFIEKIFDLVLFLPFCFILFKLKIARKTLTFLTALAFLVFQSFVSWDSENISLYGVISLIWWFFICCGLPNINQLFGIKNRFNS